MYITHNDDGKEKCYSHTVGIGIESSDMGVLYPMEGYGEDFQEALEDFTKKLDIFVKHITDFQRTLNELDVVEVDCSGKPLRKD